MADAVCETLSAGFRNDDHKSQWRMTLVNDAAPLRGCAIKPVDAVLTEDVMAVAGS
jgi:hypothetical protein